MSSTGITFDSQREAEVYRDLKLLERAGPISGFERQRKFELIVNGKRRDRRRIRNHWHGGEHVGM
ncbi:DUF1064 domain-containing protein [Rhizobium pisi]